MIAQGKTGADVSPLVAAVRRHPGRGGQATEAAEKESTRLKKLLAEAPLEKAMLQELVAA